MPEHDPPWTERLALYMREGPAEKAAHDEAIRLVERWNAALAAGRGGCGADDPLRCVGWGAVA